MFKLDIKKNYICWDLKFLNILDMNFNKYDKLY